MKMQLMIVDENGTCRWLFE